jgi:GT2 family glycosyltransferase
MGVDILGFPASGSPNEEDVFYADGACFFIRRDIFEELGAFDPIILCFRGD